jgi:hypothetical protein
VRAGKTDLHRAVVVDAIVIGFRNAHVITPLREVVDC